MDLPVTSRKASCCIDSTAFVPSEIRNPRSIVVEQRRCPDVIAGLIDVSVLAILGGNKREALMEILNVS